MPADEIILFMAIIALALALIVVLVAPKIRAGAAAAARMAGGPAAEGSSRPRGSEASPALGDRSRADLARAMAAATLASAPSATSASAAGPAATATPAASEALFPPPPRAAMVPAMTCATCRRRFAGAVKFCPYDGRVLARDNHPGVAEPDTATPVNRGKICPSCARKYEGLAVVCGRDGSALVSVN